MVRDRTIRRAVERELGKQLAKTQQRGNGLYSKLGKVTGVLVTLFGLWVGFLNIIPIVSVNPQPPLVSSDAFSAPFVVSNDGYLPLYDVHFRCSPRRISYRKPGSRGGLDVTTSGSEEEETGGIESRAIAARLLPHQKASFPCLFPNQHPEWLTSADVAIVVVYSPTSWPHIRRNHVNHFSMSRDTSGQYNWLEEPFQSD
jgi:hypothetical protein